MIRQTQICDSKINIFITRYILAMPGFFSSKKALHKKRSARCRVISGQGQLCGSISILLRGIPEACVGVRGTPIKFIKIG